MATHTPRWRSGRRVVVMNPGPMARGVVLADSDARDGHVHVGWDDGDHGWPQARLLVPEDEARRHAARRRLARQAETD